MIAPCTPWISGDDVAACSDLATSDADVFADAAEIASELLFRSSGQRFPGDCPRTIRPTQRNCTHWAGVDPPYGGWTSVWDRWIVGRWGCPSTRQIDLYGAPVREVTEVRIGGVVLDPAAYRLDQGHYLVRTDGGSWPGCQDVSRPITAPGTLQISYRWGASVPASGRRAAIQLACEIAKVCATTDEDECSLPDNVTSVQRQGVTWTLAPNSDRILSVPSGLDVVDLFLTTYPNRTRRPVRISGPTSPTHRSVTP